MQPLAACMDEGGNGDLLGYAPWTVTPRACVNRSFLDMRAFSYPQQASVSPNGPFPLTHA